MANNMIMQDEDLLYVLLGEYFEVMKIEGKHPTIPGLALAICFYRTQDIIQTLKKWEEGDSPYPEQAIQYLLGAITRIEDHYLQEGLDAKIPAALAKFCLGAYHKIQEPNRADNSAQQSNVLQIVFEGGDDQSKFPSITNVNQLSGAGNNQLTDDQNFEIELKEVM